MSVHRFCHEAMATVFEIRCDHPDARYAAQAAQAGFDLVDRIEQQFSRFIGNSDVSRVNQLAAGESTQLSPWTAECLEIAFRMHEVTGGAFDVSIGSGLDGLVLDTEALAVRAAASDVSVDLGGIGKGYAVDRVADLLVEWEIPRSLVHGGFSSVRALDAPEDQDGWPLTVSSPGARDQELLARLSATHVALSASGTQKGDHIRDPRTGQPARPRVVWVAVPGPDAGPSPAAVAETLSTAFMVLPVPAIEDLCRSAPGLEAWIVLDPTEPEASARGGLLHLGALSPGWRSQTSPKRG